jgi:hypothetical protein
MRRLSPRVSPATALAAAALFIALGGTSVAAISVLPRASVGTAQLKNNAVNSAKVKDGSLRRADFARNQLPAGPAGPVGPAGPPGPAGPSAKWALVNPTGSIVAQSGGITVTAKPGPGQYILDFGSAVAGKLILVSSGRASDPDFRGAVSAGPCGGTAEGSVCSVGNDSNHVQVITNNPGGTAREDHSFYVAVVG